LGGGGRKELDMLKLEPEGLKVGVFKPLFAIPKQK
jgi:hypothetical protein